MRALEAVSDRGLAELAGVLSASGADTPASQAPATMRWLLDELGREQTRRAGLPVEADGPLPAWSTDDLSAGARTCIAMHDAVLNVFPKLRGRLSTEEEIQLRAEFAMVFETVGKVLTRLLEMRAESTSSSN